MRGAPVTDGLALQSQTLIGYAALAAL